jgi:hypothetical protein
MASCPNCGRRTQRTKDWVCQWCGYPLLYGSFKPIDKTYRELQEERNPSYRSEEEKTGPEYEKTQVREPEVEPEPEPPPKAEPLWKLRRPLKPAYPSKPQPAPQEEIEPQPEPEPAPRPAPRPVAQTWPQPAAKPAPELAPLPRPEALPVSRPEPVLFPEAEPSPQPEMRPEPPLRSVPAPQPVTPSRVEPPPVLRPVAQPRPEPPPAPQPEPVTLPSLNSIQDGTQLTIDQIDGLLRADSMGASAALKDKTLIIKGIVNKVFIRDHIDVRYLILTGARKVVWTARCGFEKESVPQMSRLSEGQAVALSGKYDGYSKNVIFKDCTLLGAS